MTETTPAPKPRFSRITLAYDAVLAFGLLALVWAGMWVPDMLFQAGRRLPRGMGPFEHSMVTPPLAFAIAALCILPLVLRRRFPVSVLVVTAAGTILYQVLGHFPPSLVVAGLLLALYTAGTLIDRKRLAWIAIPLAIAVTASQLPEWGNALFWPDMVRTFAIMAVAAVVGDATRNRRAYVVQVEMRAAEAERTREEEAERRVDEERLRIARELHDVTAHSLSIVAVQSGVALHVLDTDPAAARAALTAIRQTSRDSLQELRGMLGILRSSGDAPSNAPLAPSPGLARLDDVIRPLREAGLHVEVTGLPLAEALPAIVDASAYRIVQESLTNVLRHAASASVRVTVARDDDALRIEVTDDGTGATGAAAPVGHGITGMRERALALGGTFAAGPRADGGWRVAALLPLTARNGS
jgi:signal transduction histidine kinase